MKYFIIIMAVGLWVTVAAAPQAAPETAADDDDDDDTDFTPTKNKNKICITNDKREGICVDEGMCTEALNIEIGGIIDKSEQRIGTCAGDAWCCVHPNMSMFTKSPEKTTPAPPRGCRTGSKDSCPWCVSVYRDNPRTKSPELFCGGAVVGSRLVLTGAVCALSFRRSDLWVRLPGGTRNYQVDSTVQHKQYYSGTQEYDIALLLLSEDIEWPEGRREDFGACLGLRTPLAGECVAIGYDDGERLTFTPMTVTEKSCSAKGATHDAACGRASGTCSVTPGSPVLCPVSSNDLIVAGMVRQQCKEGSTTLGSLVGSADWVSEILTNLTLATDRYTISR